jgi:hypothetical protein
MSRGCLWPSGLQPSDLPCQRVLLKYRQISEFQRYNGPYRRRVTIAGADSFRPAIDLVGVSFKSISTTVSPLGFGAMHAYSLINLTAVSPLDIVEEYRFQLSDRSSNCPLRLSPFEEMSSCRAQYCGGPFLVSFCWARRMLLSIIGGRLSLWSYRWFLMAVLLSESPSGPSVC